MGDRRGPGSLAHENHHDLADRLAALCDGCGVAYQRGRVVGPSIFLGDHRADLFLAGLAGYPRGLAVIARWKEGPGSADHKLPFTVECILALGVPTYIVLDGDGWRDVVRAYLAGRADGVFLGALTVAAFADLLRAQGTPGAGGG